MDDLFRALQSEFAWGIIVGVALSVLTAVATAQLQQHIQRRRIASLCQDVTANVIRLAKSLEAIRISTKVIDRKFLELIEVEIGVWGRTREHTVVLDSATRRAVRDLFVEVTVIQVQARLALSGFDEQSKLASASASGSSQAKTAQQMATQRLADAHAQCDRLRDYLNIESPKVLTRLQKITGEEAAP